MSLHTSTAKRPTGRGVGVPAVTFGTGHRQPSGDAVRPQPWQRHNDNSMGSPSCQDQRT